VGGHLLPALGGGHVAFLFGYLGKVETADGVDGRVDWRAIVHRFVAGFFSQAMVFSSEYSTVAASNGRQPDTQRFAQKK
jgi:hypothetical protein